MFHGLSLKEYISENLHNDSEFWTAGMGNYYILSKLNRYGEKSWIQLETEVLSWSEEEQEILAYALADEQLFMEELSAILPRRVKLFSLLFLHFDTVIAYDLLDVLDFVLKDDHLESQLKERLMHKIKAIKNAH